MKIIKISLILSITLFLALFSLNHKAQAETYDLKADSLTMASVSCEVNTVCNFTATVKNIGNDFTLNFPLKSSVSGDGYIVNSPSGHSTSQNTLIRTNDYLTFTFSGLFSKLGSITLNFSVDSASYLNESNVSNNSVSLAVNVIGYDLAAETIDISPVYPIVNQNCYVRIKVKNSSSYKLYTDSGLNLLRSFQDFSIISSSSTIPSFANVINSGDYLYYGYEGKFIGSGEKTLNFTIDPDDTLKEVSLNNNTISKKIVVYNTSDTDLAIDSIVLSTDKIILGTPLDITISLKNIGKTSLTDPTGFIKSEFYYNLPNFDFGINDLTVDTYPTLSTPLNPTNVFRYKFHGIFNKPGSFNLNFSVNKSRSLLEANYDNDASSTLAVVYNSLADADNFNILSKSINFVSSTTVIISWKTDIKTTAIFNYGLAHNFVGDNKIDITNSALEHTVTLSNLQPNKNYIYMITAKNGTTEKIDMMNNFLMPEDNVLRITAGPRLNLNGKNAVFTWSTNLTASSRLYYKKKGATDLSTAGSDTAVSEHQLDLKDLAIGSYDYFLSSSSTVGTDVKTNWANFEISDTASTNNTNNTNSTDTVNSNQTSAVSLSTFAASDNNLYGQLKGKIILKVQSKGEAYYVSAKEKKLYYLGRPADAFEVIRAQGIGITNADLLKIPIGLSALSGIDTDKDGLPDTFENAIGTDINKTDTDSDSFSDKDELTTGYTPLVKNTKFNYDFNFAVKQKGKIFLQTQGRGQAWYISPTDGKRYFLATPADAFNIMRKLGAGLTNSNFDKLAGQ
jgi:hypothetical protein